LTRQRLDLNQFRSRALRIGVAKTLQQMQKRVVSVKRKLQQEVAFDGVGLEKIFQDVTRSRLG
jgi:hypothetical protein